MSEVVKMLRSWKASMNGTKPLWNMGGTGRCDGARGMVNIELDVTLATSAMEST